MEKKSSQLQTYNRLCGAFHIQVNCCPLLQVYVHGFSSCVLPFPYQESATNFSFTVEIEAPLSKAAVARFPLIKASVSFLFPLTFGQN